METQQYPRTTHVLPSFEWDPKTGRWCVLPERPIPMTDAARTVVEQLAEEEMPPAPAYQIGDAISFPWQGQIWSGPIERILVWGIWSYFSVNGKEEEEGARTRAIERSYHQPQSIEYVVQSHDHTRYVQESTVTSRVYGDEEEAFLSFTRGQEEELFA